MNCGIEDGGDGEGPRQGIGHGRDPLTCAAFPHRPSPPPRAEKPSLPSGIDSCYTPSRREDQQGKEDHHEYAFRHSGIGCGRLARAVPSSGSGVERAIALSIEQRSDGDAETLSADIGMGWSAVPLILEEMRREPDQWFWALEAITEENPVPAEALGKVRAIWRYRALSWAKTRTSNITCPTMSPAASMVMSSRS
jgi:hypothetical protein